MDLNAENHIYELRFGRLARFSVFCSLSFTFLSYHFYFSVLLVG